MRIPMACAASLMFVAGGFAQLPDFYKKVDRVTWVVENLDSSLQGWAKLGFQEFQDFGEVTLGHETLHGKPAETVIRAALGRLGPVEVTWIQPVGGVNAFSEFLAKHGAGIFSLVHRTPTKEVLDAEVQRLAALGVGILADGLIDTDSGPIHYVYFDTEAQGKYVLGLISFPPGMESRPTPSTENGELKLSQYAMVIRDLPAVSAFWKKLGFPDMEVTHPALRNLRYRGGLGEFDQQLGWQRHGEVVYEWIVPLKGPTVYEDHLKAHGEGIHHLAFDTADLDKACGKFEGAGFPVVQSGAWGEDGKPGSGRFAYSDTSKVGGAVVELLWNYRP